MKRFFVSVCSDIGKTRKNNEDNFVVNSHYNEKSADFFKQDYSMRTTPLIVGVFDGMGGTRNGEEASLLCARETIQLRQVISDCVDEESVLKKFYSHLNRVLLRRQLSSKTEIGTTASIVTVLKDKIIFSNVGDSAIFLIKNGEICKKSVDDNQAQLLLDMKAITRKQAFNHPMRNMLTQYMGMGLSPDSFEPEPHIQSVERKHARDYTIIICTDGVSSVLSDDKIMDIVTSEGCSASSLVNAALKNGAEDNATAALIKIV